MAFVLAFLNPKGGVGKSMLATNIAVALHDRGFSTALIDCDEQATSRRDVFRVEPSMTVLNPTKLEAIAEAVTELTAAHDVLVVDSPGKSGEAVSALCLVADSILIPIQSSQRDLAALGKGLTLIKTAQQARGGKPEAAIVLNFTRKRDVAARLFREQLNPLKIPVARTQIRRLDAFRDVPSVVRSENREAKDAASEIGDLIDELVVPRLHRTRKRKLAAHE
jgi:chromosome partitioning protein